MEVVSLCPLRVTSVLWQPQRGGYVLTVVAKATFRLQPVEATLAEEQEYPNDDDNYWNDDPQRSMYCPTDLVPFKARPEILLVGHAFAPRKGSVRAVVARLLVADVDKGIEVICDRMLAHDGQIRDVARFSRMPLRWERAAGGPDTNNPVGVREDARPDAYGAVPLPNLLPAGKKITSRADLWIPVGFGPIAPMWPSRWQKLGRHATRFQTDAWNDSPLPDDVDPAYFNAAPEDQRPTELRDNERITLENLHPDHPRLVTNLPGIRPAAFVELTGQTPQRIHMECDTLWIDTDRAICTLTWRGPIPMASAEQTGRVVIALEEGQKRVSWSDIQRIEAERWSSESPGGALRPKPQAAAAPVARPEQAKAAPETAAADDDAGAGRAALFSQTGVTAVKSEAQAAFSAPPARPAEMTSPRTAPAPVRPPSPTLTDVGFPALPFQPPDRDTDIPRPTSPQASGLPFAPVTPEPLATPPPPLPQSPPPLPAQPVTDSPWATGATPAVTAATVGDALAGTGAGAIAIVPAASPVARPMRAFGGREIVDLLWFDPAILPKVREHPRYKDIVTEVAPRPRKVSFDDDPFEDAIGEDEPEDIRARREIFGVIARADSIDAEGVGEAMADAVGDDGTFVPPLVLLAGELAFVFDELAALKATVAATSPFATSDKKLKDTLDTVAELLQAPWIQASTGVAEGLVQRIKDAFVQGNRALPASYLEQHTERNLLEQRAFQKRTVFGEPYIRALLAPLGVQAAIPTYLPESLSPKLPMVMRMRVRVLAEANLPQDQYETYPASLRAVAIGRVSPLPGQPRR